jgi:preprotein translocase subunit SecG
MTTFLMVLHIMVCLMLIVVVLLQRGKGSDIGAALGGGSSNTVFGSRGAGNFLTKLTSACAVIFMLTSLSLSYLGTQAQQVSVFDEEVEDILPATDSLEEVVDQAAESGGETPDASANTLEEVVPLDQAPTGENSPETPETP